MTLSDYLRVAWRRSWLIALGAILFGAGAYALTARMTPVYRAQATILVNQAQLPGAQTYQDILSSQQLTKTYAELATSDLNLQRALDRLGDRRLSLIDLEGQVSASAVSGTQLVHVYAEDADASQAASIASAVAAVFPAYVRDAQGAAASGASAEGLNTVFVAEPARTPSSPVRPNKATNTALGVLLGIVLGIAAAAILEYRDDHVDERSDVQSLGLPFLGGVLAAARPKGAGRSWVPRLQAGSGDDALAESYRQVQANLAFALAANQAKVILVTSASPGEGKSTTSANLAQALAESLKRVLLVDADLRKPDIARHFQLPKSAGLSSAFVGSPQMLLGLLKRISQTFYVLPAGPLPPNPAELLASHQMEAIIETLKQPFEAVLVDSPPIVGLADASLLSVVCDGVVLVARRGRTRRKQLLEAAEAVRASGKPLLGVIVNGQSRRNAAGYYYRYGAEAELEGGPRGPRAIRVIGARLRKSA